MVVKITQEQADYLETFGVREEAAIYYIARWGWGNSLEDGLGKVYETNAEAPFNIDEKQKMLNALINGYEIDVPKYKFYNFSNVTSIKRLYYAGKGTELTSECDFAEIVEKNSYEYRALERLGFLEEKV